MLLTTPREIYTNSFEIQNFLSALSSLDTCKGWCFTKDGEKEMTGSYSLTGNSQLMQGRDVKEQPEREGRTRRKGICVD